MSVDKRLLEILVCPVTKVPVKPLAKDQLAVLNREVEGGNVSHADGRPVSESLEEALITTDGKTIYPVKSDIPVMLEEEGIVAKQIPGW